VICDHQYIYLAVKLLALLGFASITLGIGVFMISVFMVRKDYERKNNAVNRR